jgi:hypothetical protein
MAKTYVGGLLGGYVNPLISGPLKTATASGKFSTGDMLQAQKCTNRNPDPLSTRTNYTCVGTFTWVAPAGVTKAHAVAIGGGGSGRYANSYQTAYGGAGGGLGWKNCITVVPGCGYTVVVGAGGAKPTISGTNGNAGSQSYFVNACTVKGSGGGGGTTSGATTGSYVGDSGACGGSPSQNGGSNCTPAAGGGAGGYLYQGGSGIYGINSTPTNIPSIIGSPGGGANSGGGGNGLYGIGQSQRIFAGVGVGGFAGKNACSFNGGLYGGGGTGGTGGTTRLGAGARGAVAVTTGNLRFPLNAYSPPSTPGTAPGVYTYGSSSNPTIRICMNPTCVTTCTASYFVAVAQPGNLTAETPAVFTPNGNITAQFSNLESPRAYCFSFYAVNPAGTSALSPATSYVVGGGSSYFVSGTFSWVAPTGVTSVSVVAIGGGANGQSSTRGGGGGGLGYKNNISVTPGNSYTVVAGNPGNSTGSYFINTSTVKGAGGSGSTGGSYVGDGGGNGGSAPNLGGGGAGGYSGNGGSGSASGGANGSAGSGGGGGGGGANCGVGGGGGGTGTQGQGSNGAGGLQSGHTGGGGGSGGGSGTAGCASCGHTCCSGTYVNRCGGSGGYYGGGGGGGCGRGAGGYGIVRIIWPGNLRSFPSTFANTP